MPVVITQSTLANYTARRAASPGLMLRHFYGDIPLVYGLGDRLGHFSGKMSMPREKSPRPERHWSVPQAILEAPL